MIELTYHEAAHAVVGYLVGAAVRSIAIYNPPQDELYGKCDFGLGPGDSELQLLAQLAGPVADAIRAKRNLTFFSLCRSNRGDYEIFCRLFKSIHNLIDDDYLSLMWEEPIEKYVTYMSARIKVQYLDPNWHLVKRVAEELLTTGQVMASDFQSLMLALGGHFKTGHGGSLQNRPTEHHPGRTCFTLPAGYLARPI